MLRSVRTWIRFIPEAFRVRMFSLRTAPKIPTRETLLFRKYRETIPRSQFRRLKRTATTMRRKLSRQGDSIDRNFLEGCAGMFSSERYREKPFLEIFKRRNQRYCNPIGKEGELTSRMEAGLISAEKTDGVNHRSAPSLRNGGCSFIHISYL